MLKAYIKDRIYLPIKAVDLDKLRDQYVVKQYQEDRCAKCPFLQDRHSDTCDDCPAYLGEFQLFNEKQHNGKGYVGLSIGQTKKFKKVLKVDKDEIRFKDSRTATKFKHKIKFTGTLYDYQKPAIKRMVEKGYGVLQAPPRSGKTVMFTDIMCELGVKTLIIANQYDYLEQFYETMCGSDTQKPLTNIPDIEADTRRKICGICNSVEDFEKYDVCLATYQQFINDKKGKKRLKQIKKLFGLVLIDECDLTPAEAYSRVINQFQSKYRMGCTGTTDRKDGRYFLVDHLLGPTMYTVEVETLTPRVEFIETGTVISHDYKVLAYAYRALANDTKRHDLILDWIEHDIKNGRSIVIPVATVDQCKRIVADINSRFGKEIACAFTQATAKKKENRKNIILKARKGKYKLIVGIRKMVQRGINVPAWDTLYEITPISNSPNFRQETSRILTPLEGKPQPIIRFFLDDFGLSRGCLRTCLYNDGILAMKFKVSKENWDRARRYTPPKGRVVDIAKMTPDGAVKIKKRTKQKIGKL